MNTRVITISDLRNNLSDHVIDELYGLYKCTYESTADLLLKKNEFKDKVTRVYHIALLVKNKDSIRNCLLIRKTEHGNRISLIFGKKGAETERIDLFKNLMRNGHYSEVSGAPAKILLKDATIKVSIMPESKHYYSHLSTHGKKIIFGEHKNSIEITSEARSFFVYLYEYQAIKLIEKTVSEKNIIIKLETLYENVSNTKMPALYQIILLNKIAKKLSQYGSKIAIDKIYSINEILEKLIINRDVTKSFLIAIEKLSKDEKSYIKSVLSTKTQSILKNHHEFFNQKNNSDKRDNQEVYLKKWTSKL